MTFFHDDLEAASNDQSAQANNHGFLVSSSKSPCGRNQGIFPIEEQDDEQEEDGLDDGRKTARIRSAAVRGEKEAVTPIKAFAQLVLSEHDELRLTSNRPKSPLKSLSNFNISPSPKGSGKRSDLDARADEQDPAVQIEEVARSSPMPSETATEAFLLRSHRLGKGVASSQIGDQEKHAQHDSMAYSASVSTVERMNSDRPVSQTRQADGEHSKSLSNEMLYADD